MQTINFIHGCHSGEGRQRVVVAQLPCVQVCRGGAIVACFVIYPVTRNAHTKESLDYGCPILCILNKMTVPTMRKRWQTLAFGEFTANAATFQSNGDIT